MKLDALIAFTQASYRNMKSYFTSKLIEHNKNNLKHIYYNPSCFVECLLYPIACCLPHLRNSVYDDSSFLWMLLEQHPIMPSHVQGNKRIFGSQ